MKRAYVFPGQGAQYPGMGADLYEAYPKARDMFNAADQQLGFRLSEVMFRGTTEALRSTQITQPAVFLHAVVAAACLPTKEQTEGVAGHSLGEFSALVAAEALSFLEALSLVACRAEAMQAACEAQPSTMAVVLGASADTIEQICEEVSRSELVVAANYNCPEQIVISGTKKGISLATEALRVAGAKRVLPIAVGGAFHSPLMASAQQRLATAIEQAPFQPPKCPIYQNTDGEASTDVATIRSKLIAQLTAPVRWERLIRRMAEDGFTHFLECGSGTVLQGLIKKIAPIVSTSSTEK